jgi:hypothetical protein
MVLLGTVSSCLPPYWRSATSARVALGPVSDRRQLWTSAFAARRQSAPGPVP